MNERVAGYLKQRIGLEVESIGEAALERALKLRMEACALTDDAYLAHLLASPDELQALVEAVVVGETWFFRYPMSFSALQQVAQQKRRAGVLRILSLPCSSGEEPYSIAMSLLDAGFASKDFAIDALDVSEQALAQAEQGLYGGNAFRGAALGFRERYFTHTAQGYQLHERVKACVQLQKGNLLDPTLALKRGQYDVVFCRNLLIYFDRATQLRALEVLKGLTAETGVLFIGPAEASLFSAAGLAPLDFSQAFAFSRQTVPQNLLPTAAPKPTLAPKPLPVKAPVPLAPKKSPVKAQVRLSPKAHDTALIQGLAEVRALADQNLLQNAQRKAQQLLDAHGAHSEIFYWQALLSEVQGDRLKAQQLYRKVLYLEPNHAQAIAHLATLLSAQGEYLAAQRLEQRAQQGVKRRE